jgi:hypothetical protein
MDMEPLFDYPVPMSSFLEGKWRMTVNYDFYDRGKHEVNCVRFYGDVMQV